MTDPYSRSLPPTFFIIATSYLSHASLLLLLLLPPLRPLAPCQIAPQVLARSNTMSVVLQVGMFIMSLLARSPHVQDNGVMRFVKYLGGNAPSSRWDVAIDFKVGDEEQE